MATRANISLVVKISDIGKLVHFNKLPNGVNIEVADDDRSLLITNRVLTIRSDHDNHPANIGELLLSKFNDYDSVLNLMLVGDVSSLVDSNINNTNIVYYTKARQGIKACFENDLIDYLYKFENGVWYVKRHYDKNGWCNLRKYIQEKFGKKTTEYTPITCYPNCYNIGDWL